MQTIIYLLIYFILTVITYGIKTSASFPWDIIFLQIMFYRHIQGMKRSQNNYCKGGLQKLSVICADNLTAQKSLNKTVTWITASEFCDQWNGTQSIRDATIWVLRYRSFLTDSYQLLYLVSHKAEKTAVKFTYRCS